MGMFVLFKPNVEKLKAKKDMNGLLKALQYMGSSEVRREAATALDELRWEPHSDVERSYYLLGKQHWSELARVSEPAVRVLVEQLKKGNRQEAATFLGEIADARAIEPLIAQLYKEALNTPDYAGKEALLGSIVQALEKMGKAVVGPFIERIIATGFTAGSTPAHPAMILMGPSPDTIRSQHAMILARMGDLAFDPLVKALNVHYDSPEADHFRRHADARLGWWGKRERKPVDVQSWIDLRRYAALTLGMMGDRRAVGHIVRVLQEDGDGLVRGIAARALGMIRDTTTIEPLMHALEDEDGIVCSDAAWALGEIGDERNLEALTRVSKSRGFWAAREALQAIDKIKHKQTIVEKQFCIECGAQLPSGSRFCGECGVQQ